MYKTLQGRQLLKQEIPHPLRKYLKKDNSIKKVKAMTYSKKDITCRRCGHVNNQDSCQINGGFYCDYCLNMGRVTSEDVLYRIPKSPRKTSQKTHCFWQGELTKQQACISQEILDSYRRKRHHFVHAVTGAGKTEMLFPLIEQVLTDGKVIGIATPRIDVCLELYPRMKEAFQDTTINLLYGHSSQTYNGASFIICTTHQLMRFYRYFDVLVIDEADAFPYVHSDELQYVAKQSLEKKGCFVFLTATSNPRLEHYSNTEKSMLAKRFHGQDLPVPKTIYCRNLAINLRKGKLPKKMRMEIEASDQSYILFFPDIALMSMVYPVVKKTWQKKKVAMVHASSDTREQVVKQMREGKIDLLLSTTILERGVTFKNISVMVVCADHRVFNRASLVQIAGRVGRSVNYPTGHVIFLHEGKNQAMVSAIKEIKQMNKEAKR